MKAHGTLLSYTIGTSKVFLKINDTLEGIWEDNYNLEDLEVYVKEDIIVLDNSEELLFYVEDDATVRELMSHLQLTQNFSNTCNN